MYTFDSLLFKAKQPAWRRPGVLGGLVLVLALAGCAVGPDYVAPTVAVGEGYKEVAGWKQAQPSDDALRADWWRLYDDAELDRLMAELLASNLNIIQAEAQYREAQALLRGANAGFFPTVSAGASVARAGSGSGQASSSASGSSASSQYSVNGAVSWEPDLWGEVRRTIEAGEAGAQASTADLANTRLSMQSTLTQTYFRLRGLDAEKRLYEQTVKAYEQSLQMTQNRYAVGVAAQADVAAARTQLENARVQYQATERQRAQFEHALAVLMGRAPSDFGLAFSPGIVDVPTIPVGLPSHLLERRPDVAAAERRTAAANAQIGIAQAAWFPDLTLSAQGGFRSGQWAQWLTAPFNFWSLGPSLALTIFDGGARQARVDQTRAAYDAQVAGYRLTVLTALREVEDYLVQLHGLGREQDTQARALAAARESLELTRNQYEAGIIDFLSVVQVQTSALAAERSALSLKTERLIASVQLIAALGGGWNGTAAGEAPSSSAAEPPPAGNS